MRTGRLGGGVGWLGACLCGLVLAGLPALAQPTAEAAAPPAAVVPDPPPVVPVPEISARAERLRRLLREVDPPFAEDSEIAEVEVAFDELAGLIGERVPSIDAQLAEGVDLGRLSKITNDWEARRGRLEGWSDWLTARAEGIEADLESLSEQRALWERTRDAARAANAPAEVIQDVQQSLAAIRARRRDLEADRRALLGLLNRVSDEHAAVDDLLLRVREAQVQAQARMPLPDARPMWSSLAVPDPVAGLDLRAAVERDVRELRGFLAEVRALLVPLAVFLAATVAVAFRVRARLRLRSEEDGLSGTVQVFDRPLSVALLGFVLTLYLAYPNAPPLAVQGMGVLLLVPVLRVISPIVHRAYHPLLWLVGAFFVTDRVRAVLAASATVERFLFFAEVVAAGAILLFLLRPGRLARIPPEQAPPRVLGQLLRLAAALVVASAVANLVGYLGVARILGEGTIISASAGLVVFAAYRVAATVALLLLGPGPQRLSFVERHGARIFQLVDLLLRGVALGYWAFFTLRGFGIWSPVRDALAVVFLEGFQVGSATVRLADVLAFIGLSLLAWYLSRAVRTLLHEDVLSRFDVDRGVRVAFSTIASYVVLVIGFLFALTAAGFDMTRFTLLAGAFGVGIGFGLQNIVNNFVSGLILLLERPVKTGDVVQVGEYVGHITHIGIRASTLRTWKGSEVVVPNANLISETLTNWTLSDTSRRVDVPVGVAYGSDHEAVLRVLRDAARAAPGVLRHPEPMILFQGFGDSSLDFEVRFWATSDDFLSVRTQVVSSVYRALGDAGIEIPFPQRDVHLRVPEDGGAG